MTASLILRKLGSYPRQSGLALALRELGRIERTLFMLEWLQNPALRRRVHAGLNKVNLAVVAIVAWNTVYLERAVASLNVPGKRSGQTYWLICRPGLGTYKSYRGRLALQQT